MMGAQLTDPGGHQYALEHHSDSVSADAAENANALLVQLTRAVIAIQEDAAQQPVSDDEAATLQDLLNTLLHVCFVAAGADSLQTNGQSVNALKLLQCVALRVPQVFARPRAGKEFGSHVALVLVGALARSAKAAGAGVADELVHSLAVLVEMRAARFETVAQSVWVLATLQSQRHIDATRDVCASDADVQGAVVLGAIRVALAVLQLGAAGALGAAAAFVGRSVPRLLAVVAASRPRQLPALVGAALEATQAALSLQLYDGTAADARRLLGAVLECILGALPLSGAMSKCAAAAAATWTALGTQFPGLDVDAGAGDRAAALLFGPGDAACPLQLVRQSWDALPSAFTAVWVEAALSRLDMALPSAQAALVPRLVERAAWFSWEHYDLFVTALGALRRDVLDASARAVPWGELARSAPAVTAALAAALLPALDAAVLGPIVQQMLSGSPQAALAPILCSTMVDFERTRIPLLGGAPLRALVDARIGNDEARGTVLAAWAYVQLLCRRDSLNYDENTAAPTLQNGSPDMRDAAIAAIRADSQAAAPVLGLLAAVAVIALSGPLLDVTLEHLSRVEVLSERVLHDLTIAVTGWPEIVLAPPRLALALRAAEKYGMVEPIKLARRLAAAAVAAVARTRARCDHPSVAALLAACLDHPRVSVTLLAAPPWQSLFEGSIALNETAVSLAARTLCVALDNASEVAVQASGAHPWTARDWDYDSSEATLKAVRVTVADAVAVGTAYLERAVSGGDAAAWIPIVATVTGALAAKGGAGGLPIVEHGVLRLVEAISGDGSQKALAIRALGDARAAAGVSSTRRLLEPFGDRIAQVFADVYRRDGANNARALLHALEFPSTGEFVQAHAEHLVPLLVLRDDAEMLERLAAAARVAPSYLVASEMAAVLTAVFLNGEIDVQTGLTRVLRLVEKLVARERERDGRAAAVRFSLSDMLKTCLLRLVVRLALELGSSSESRRALAVQALKLVEKRTRGTETNGGLAGLLSRNLLGVLTHINERIADRSSDGSQSRTSAFEQAAAEREQVQCVRALNELIVAAGADGIAGAMHQLLATLQTAVGDGTGAVGVAAVPAWASLVRVGHAEQLAEHVAVIAVVLDEVADNVDLSNVFEPMFGRMSEAELGQLPRMMSNDGSGKLESWRKRARALSKTGSGASQPPAKDATLDAIEQVSRCLKLLMHEHRLVCESALKDLVDVLRYEQPVILGRLRDEDGPMVTAISAVVSRLLELVREHAGDSTVAQLSCECLGMIGAVDPARLDVRVRQAPPFVVLDGLEGIEETADFVVHMIEHVLSKAFRRAHSSQLQGHLSYAIQELLQQAGLWAGVVLAPSDMAAAAARVPHVHTVETAAHLRRRWAALPRSVLEAITPLLTSKYSLQTGEADSVRGAAAAAGPPIYATSADFREWVQRWTSRLLRQVRLGTRADLVYGALRSVVAGGDPAIARFLLPHVALHVLTFDDPDVEEGVLAEITHVLTAAASDTPAPDSSAAQAVYALLDHAQAWLRLQRHRGRSNAISAVGRFVARVPQPLLARASLQCHAYARALLHYEQHVRELRAPLMNNPRTYEALSESIQELTACDQAAMQPHYAYLQRIYAHLDEPDGMAGLAALVTTPTLEQQVLEHEAAGDWMAAQGCYEVAVQQHANNFDAQCGLLQNLQRLGHYDSMLSRGDALAARNPEWAAVANGYAIEACWRLGAWDETAQRLERPHPARFNVGLGKVVIAAATDPRNMDGVLTQARAQAAAALAAAASESHRRAYDALLQLHLLNEVEAGSFVDRRCWDLRLELASQTVHVTEPILSLRRVLIAHLFNHEPPATLARERDLLWLRSAKLARKAGHLQTAFTALVHAGEASRDAQTACDDSNTRPLNLDATSPHFSAAVVRIERAKWFWGQAQTHKALFEVTAALELAAAALPQVELRQRPRSGAGVATPPNAEASAPVATAGPRALPVGRGVLPQPWSQTALGRVHTKAQLLLAQWSEATCGSHSNDILERYGDACVSQPSWEKCYYFVGRYYDKLFLNERNRQASMSLSASSSDAPTGNDSGATPSPLRPNQHGLFVMRICRNYLRALQLGTKYMYQSLPRLLTLWLDFEAFVGGDASTDDGLIAKLASLNRMMRRAVDALPAALFLAALPQLASRIGHANPQIFTVLEALLLKVLCVYPQQALWQFVSLYKSTHALRNSRCRALFGRLAAASGSRERGQELEMLVGQFTRLTDQLVKLCNCRIAPRQTHLTLSTEFAPLRRMTPLQVLVPLQASLAASTASNAADAPTIARFHDHVELMRSLQKPRKVTVLGSDGRDYIFLCKPQDDLRKDGRLMDCNAVINTLLRRDPEARRRRLHIRTYAVVPLNEGCGLIEWVNHTVAFRHIVSRLYAARGLGMHFSEIQQLYSQTGLAPVERMTARLLPKHPPVFHEWFREQFAEPTRWFASRVAYASTLAVMSMVGYVLGLGDRHGENILFDTVTGETVHVDFNCLFEKGLTLLHPERVPFRLTHNMIDALGVSGVDGVFRTCCHVSMRLLRENRESLLSVLETFIHDPLVEWGRADKRRVPHGPAGRDAMDAEARKHLATIDRKLQGVFQVGFPLSVEGQVHELINQATDLHNLAVMYIGWASYQ